MQLNKHFSLELFLGFRSQKKVFDERLSIQLYVLCVTLTFFILKIILMYSVWYEWINREHLLCIFFLF